MEPQIFATFKEARKAMKSTSRAKNPDWYREANELDFQLHLLPVGDVLQCSLLERHTGEWKMELGTLELDASSSELSFFLETIRRDSLPKNARSLGVVLHLNREASVFEFSLPEEEKYEHPKQLRELIVEDPGFVLQDRTIDADKLQFRIYPTPGSHHAERVGSAIATNRAGEGLLERLRQIGNDANFPIRTLAISSPLLLLSRLPRTFGELQKPFCVMLRFDAFSFFGFYRADGELILLRSLKHPNFELPANLESILRTTAAAVELPEIELRVFDCRKEDKRPLEAHLRDLIYSFEFSVDSAPEGQGELPIELSVYRVDDDDTNLAYSGTETFGSVLEEKWHLQDFLPASQTELSTIPTQLDMKLLRWGRIAFRAGAAALLALGAFVAWSSFSKMSQEAWKHAEFRPVRSAQYALQLNNAKLLGGLLDERSNAWTNLELLARLFPTDQSVLCRDFDYSASAEKSYTGKAALVRNWKIAGVAKSEAYGLMESYESKQKVSEIFTEVYEATGNPLFNLESGSRSLTVNLELEQNSATDDSKPGQSAYPFRFNLSLTQRIESSDPLSLPLAKLK
ncbi:MAG: hypothetical protein Q7Q71_13205 [Verrucomicrobiota bacterium JB023]|nr:hypothetical protein [Verrucomicrobiota bacterium JB023]